MSTSEMSTTLSPYRVASETFVIPWILEAPPVGFFCMNSMVIRGREPVIVDTGSPLHRDAFLDQVWGIVEPEDVRWIYLSHDDRDHSGNLMQVLDACPNATLLTTWFSVGRMSDEWMLPLDRCRFLNDGEQLDAGDRTLSALRPPVFDSPTTRGLFDDSTGVYWSVDTFAMPVPGMLEDVDDVPESEFADGQRMGAGLVAPWGEWLDERKYLAHVDTVQSLPIEVAAACHAPALRGRRFERAFELVRELPSAAPFQEFVQADLDQWMAAMAQAHAGEPMQDA